MPAMDDVESVERKLAARAARQQGLLTRDEAVKAGLSLAQVQYRLARGRWVRMLPSVYAVAGAPQSWRQRVTAAVLWLEGDGVACGRSAAALWGFPDFGQGPVEIACTRRVRAPVSWVTIHQVAHLERSDRAVVDGIAVTSAARTLVDLAALGSERTLEKLLDHALRHKLTTAKAVRWCLERLPARGRENVASLRELVADRVGRAEQVDSALETRLLAALKGEGLPRPVVHYEVTAGARLLGEVDLAWPQEKVAVQAQGYGPHSGSDQWHRDQDTSSLLSLAGWCVLFVTWRDLERRPAVMVQRIRQALEARGARPSEERGPRRAGPSRS